MLTSPKKESRISSLQALRAWAFLGVFLSHAGSKINWATLGVSVFFMLSGFLMYKRHSNDHYNLNMSSMLKYSWSKISKLYPLHIITMCLIILLKLAYFFRHGTSITDVLYLLMTIILNVTLKQSWFPNSSVNVSLNGVAWYLSVSLFLFFLFPVICNWIKTRTQKNLLLLCFSILIIQVLACIPLILLLGDDSPIYIWFMYCFPIFRLGDFIVGCCLSKWYFKNPLTNSKHTSRNLSSILEFLALLITISLLLWIGTDNNSILLKALQNWTSVNIILAGTWIILFAECNGMLTNVMSNPLSIYIGNISSYLFLIHCVVTQYSRAILFYLHYEPTGLVNLFFILAELVASIALSQAYIIIEKKFIHKAALL